jgi:hypothetical protein
MTRLLIFCTLLLALVLPHTAGAAPVLPVPAQDALAARLPQAALGHMSERSPAARPRLAQIESVSWITGQGQLLITGQGFLAAGADGAQVVTSPGNLSVSLTQAGGYGSFLAVEDTYVIVWLVDPFTGQAFFTGAPSGSTVTQVALLKADGAQQASDWFATSVPIP